jgi:outer membrane receptor for ferrienterochelin and colicins
MLEFTMKKAATILISMILSVAFATQVIAQSETGTIQGTITQNGEPLPGVNIYLPKIERGASTDADGYYEIKNVSKGSYTLRASYVGYKKSTRDVQITAGSTVTVDIILEETAQALGEVVVTGTMRETYVKDSPVKVEVVNVERLTQGKTSSNFMDLVGSVNGLSTQLNCGVCGTNAIRINGVEGPNTAVLIDGMPIMGDLASVYGLNGISPSIIDQVEVIKGPQSTLYGTQALGGVVNIITKNPTNTPSFSAEAYGKSTTQEGSLNLAVSPKVGRFKGFVSGDLNRKEHYFDNNADGFNDQPNQSRVALFGKGVLQGKDGEKRLNVAAKYLNENRTGGVSAFSDDIRGSDQIYGESIYTRRAEFLTEYRPAGMDERLRINTALTYHSQDSYYGDSFYDATQNIAFGQLTYDQPLSDRFRILTGTTLRYETYNDNTPATSGGADLRFIPGVFTQAELSMGDITLLGGLRVDHHTEHGFVPAPRLSAKYSPTDLTTFRASSGTGFRVVNVFTEDHQALTGSRDVVFNEDLDPEKSRSVTASLEQIIPFGVNPLTLSLDGFYTRFSNKIIPNYDQDPNLIVYENLDGFSVTQGFSIGLDQNFTALPFSYNASFTLMDVFSNENGNQRAEAYAPDFLGNFGASYQLRNIGASISYSGSLVGSKRLPDNYVDNFGRDAQSPVFSTHNLKFTKEFTNVNDAQGIGIEAYVSAQNIFNYTQGTPLVDAANPFSPDFDTIYTYGPIVGRTFSIGARLNLR